MSIALTELGGKLSSRFVLGRRLGAGAFGTVYEARDVADDARVAIKQLHVLDGDALYRFKQEFRSAADIAHPNLVGLKELFSADGHWYMTMEFIDGVDFRIWVRGDSAPVLSLDDDQTTRWKVEGPDGKARSPLGVQFDEERLRAALPQLVDAVHELHRHNVLHRDLKPSNVMIDRTERLRVLDYGLVAPLGPEGLHASLDEVVVGTPAYMSPEQAQGFALATASDWYAVGVMLFEVMTGRLPFEGTAREVLWKKAHEDGPDPRIHDRALPDDLSSVCRALLKRQPEGRPGHADIVAVVGRPQAARFSAASLGGDVFVGRAAELQALRDAAARAVDRSVVAHVQGPSGVGKSALVRRFLEDVEPHALVLAGRCYERESVPFKALDSLVDGLTEHLRSLSAIDVDRVLPRHAAALVRVFPVLSRLGAFASARLVDRVTDPNEIRRRAAAALRELLAGLARERPLVMWIDDLQWGDTDSAALFRELIAPPDPPPMLLVVSYRSEDAASDMVATLRGRRSTEDVVELAIRPLVAAEAEQLATTLLGGAKVDGGARPGADGRAGGTAPIADGSGALTATIADGSGALPAVRAGEPAVRDRAAEARRIAAESGGIPFFVHELARGAERGTLSLAEMLARRIDALPVGARRLLDVVAAAGGPISHRAARTAAGTGLDDVIVLRAARFLRSRGDGDGDFVECFHDRVRETALEHLADPKDVHLRVARALEREPAPDPEALARHFRAAGDDARTLEYAERAAKLASEKLAFERAAALYELALELAPADARADLQLRYAESLANAGRGVDAARAFRTAADNATGEAAVRLRTRAAQQFLRSGHLEDGVRELEPALAHLALALPKSPASALVTLLGRRARLKVRGLKFVERREHELPGDELHRIDLCWSVGNGLGGVDMIRAATFQSQHLLLALGAGEPYRVSRALAWEAIVRSMEGGDAGWKRAAVLGASAKAIAERIDHPHARAWAAATDAILAECQGKWREAQACSLTTIALFRDAQTDVAWEVGSMYAWWLLPALYFSGELVELAAQAPGRVDDVEEVGDLYTATSMRTYVIPRMWLAAGDVDRAEAETREAIDRWSRAGWHLQHWCDLMSRAEIALYRGDGAAAVRAWDAEQRELRKSLLMRMCMIGTQTRFSLGRAGVAAAQRDRDPALRKRATKLAAQLENAGTAWARNYARTLEAGLAMIAGDRDAAHAALADAAAGYRAADMRLHAHAADLVRGRLVGGDAGRELVAQAEAWMHQQKVGSPATLAASLVPGFTSR
jgi:eukaryotic-like serine/threonine-protein kinase